MTAPTLARERTALAWRRTALGAAGCALLFAHEATTEDGAHIVFPLAATTAALLLAVLGWYRGRSLHRGHIEGGHRLVATTTLTVTLVVLIAVAEVVFDS
ncbi:DUF202 domain-containing protein [Nocardia caishijiensis]|uniref:Uncharacterized protein DUF202 n=1 Tax=Nocardia caishijiensis TaxID=184756 RepID=A0ABQ6YQW4_9NOCA|nr:DUF202 domain-containing protein [Nocardia caishijiensis]KAF0847846.1 uncharacterized protein DUF202 [Nocardia caishijiensis]